MNTKPELKKSILGFQMDIANKQAFVAKAQPYGGTSFVLRELAMGFVEGRVFIKQPVVTSNLYTTQDEFMK
jgi:hypothetical protein